MNENNLDYLKNSLKYLGFGDKLNDVLERAIRQELPKFTIALNNVLTPPGAKKEDRSMDKFIRYDLNFSKSKDSDMYFLNNYQATLQKPNAPVREHTFIPGNNNWTTAKEAYNLLSGRSVNKDINPKETGAEKVNVWIKLDLDVKDARGYSPQRNFYPQYGYDLDKTLAKYPILELASPEKKAELVASLKRGNLASAEIEIKGQKTQVYIAANPEMKSVNIYDKKMSEIRDYAILSEKSKEKIAQSEPEKNISSDPAVEENKGRSNASSKDTPEIASGQSVRPWEQDAAENKSRSVGR